MLTGTRGKKESCLGLQRPVVMFKVRRRRAKGTKTAHSWCPSRSPLSRLNEKTRGTRQESNEND